MALYDVRCLKCGRIEEDVYATSHKEIVVRCCGSKMAWKPFVRTQSTRTDINCPYSGEKFHSYSDLEKWSKRNGKTLVPTKEYERDHLKKRSPDEKLSKANPAVREELKKQVYRQRHRLPKE